MTAEEVEGRWLSVDGIYYFFPTLNPQLPLAAAIRLRRICRLADAFGFLINRALAHSEATFFQDAHRGNVVRGHTGVEWPLLFQAEEGRESPGHNATPPKCAPDPVADLAFPVTPLTADVSGYLAIGHDGLFQAGVVREDLCQCSSNSALSRERNTTIRHRHGISLMFEKDGNIARFDVAQEDLCFHRRS